MAIVKLGTLTIIGQDANGRRLVTAQRSSINPSHDESLCYKALEFESAAARDGRTFVCSLIPTSKWRIALLKLAGVQQRDIRTGRRS